MAYARKDPDGCGYEKQIVYMASDRKKIAKRYKIGQKIKIEVIVRDDLDRCLRSEIVTCRVVGKYPYFLQYVDPKGFSHSIDYIELDKMSRRIGGEGGHDVQ